MNTSDVGAIIGVSFAGLTAFGHFLPSIQDVGETDSPDLIRSGEVYGSVITLSLAFLISWKANSSAAALAGLAVCAGMIAIYERVLRGCRP